MRNRFWLSALFVVFTVAGIMLRPSHAFATCPPTDVQTQFTAADVVATGTVYSIVTLDEGGREVYLDPLTIYKGGDVVNDSLIIAVPDNTENWVGFAEGDAPYLLFLKDQNDGAFSSAACSGTRLLGTGLTDAEKTVLGTGTDFASLAPTVTEGDQLPVDKSADTVSVSGKSWEQRAATWIHDHRPWSIVIGTWLFITHGLALWAAGRLNQRGWFIILLILPTLGLLPLVYLVVIGNTAFRPTPPILSPKV